MTKLLLLAVSVFASLQLIQPAETAGKFYKLPVILPPFGVKDSGVTPTSDPKADSPTCLFYLEGLGITVFNGEKTQPTAWGAVIDSANQTHSFEWADAYADCKNLTSKPSTGNDFQPQLFSFTVKITTGAPVEARTKDKLLFTLPNNAKFSFILRFRTVPAFGWQLYDIEALDDISIPAGDWVKQALDIKKGDHADNGTAIKMDIGTYNGYNYACGNTKAAIFSKSADKGKGAALGIFFHNLQVQPSGYVVDKDTKKVHFTRRTSDCVGTFTHGSFMGIIVALVLATVLVFGFLMLNSVQTVDRFDDPKQKQLVINAKE